MCLTRASVSRSSDRGSLSEVSVIDHSDDRGSPRGGALAGVGVGARGSAVSNTPSPPALHQCAPSGAGAREGRGRKILGNDSHISPGSFSHPHPGSQASAPGPEGGLDLNPQQSSSAPKPKQVHQSFRERAAPGVPNTAQWEPNECFLAAGGGTLVSFPGLPSAPFGSKS